MKSIGQGKICDNKGNEVEFFVHMAVHINPYWAGHITLRAVSHVEPNQDNIWFIINLFDELINDYYATKDGKNWIVCDEHNATDATMLVNAAWVINKELVNMLNEIMKGIANDR